jgi:hypothetical protein
MTSVLRRVHLFIVDTFVLLWYRLTVSQTIHIIPLLYTFDAANLLDKELKSIILSQPSRQKLLNI